jgi:hypothetical protein
MQRRAPRRSACAPQRSYRSAIPRSAGMSRTAGFDRWHSDVQSHRALRRWSAVHSDLCAAQRRTRGKRFDPRMLSPHRDMIRTTKSRLTAGDHGSGRVPLLCHTATGIRTPVSAMRGRRPSPLDDSGARSAGPRLAKRSRQARPMIPMTRCSADAFRGRSTGPWPVRYLRILTGTRMWRNW